METLKYQYFQGVKFTRDDKTGYYLNSTVRKRMHTYVWEFYNGAIPDGFCIHHIDRNRANNDISNLELVERRAHAVYHGKLLTEEERQRRRENLTVTARPKAAEWHKSDAGQEWHKKHYANTSKAIFTAVHTAVCQNCGKEYPAHHNSKFCSNACKSNYRRKQGVDNEIRKCVICDKEFAVNKYSYAKTCSPHCAGILAHTKGEPHES